MQNRTGQEPTKRGSSQQGIGTYWDVFMEPSKCFEGLNLRPRWLVPLIICIIMGFATSLVTYSRIDMAEAMRDQIVDSRAAEQLTSEQIDQQVEMAVKFGRISALVAPFVIIPLFMLFTAGLIMLGIFVTGSEVIGQVRKKECSSCGDTVSPDVQPGDNCPHCGVVWGNEILSTNAQAESSSAFKKVFAITASSMLFYNVVAGILTIAVIMTASDPNSLNLRNLVSTNPAFLVDAGESRVLYNFLTHLDILVWYTIFLLGLGISKIADKCSLTKGIMIIGFWYLIYALGHTGITALF